MGAGSSCAGKPTALSYIVGKKFEFKNNSVTEVTVNKNDSVLLAKYQGHLYAFGTTCPHYGAPLAKGVFSDGKIRCPWHGACFNIKTGDIEDFPGLDCIPVYKVAEENENIVVFCETELPTKIVRPLWKAKKNKRDTIVIIGGGAAACVAAQTLRQNKYDGKIIMVSNERHLPYDRTLINKMPGIQINDIRLRDMDYYRSGDIEIINSTECERIDLKSQKVFLKNSKTNIDFNKLLIATGSKPKIMEINGIDLKNIRTIYTLEDSYNICKEVEDKVVVIIGGTFFGLELAWALREQCPQIKMIASGDVPMSYLLGKTAGMHILKQALQNCSNFSYFGPDEVCNFIGNSEGEVVQVLTSRQGLIETDYVILAMWNVPNSDVCLSSPEISLDATTKAILVNKFLQTSVENVYAAGDVTSFPLDLADSNVQMPYWNIACRQGKTAALNMIGVETSVSDAIPFYWASFFDMKLRICGYIKNCDEIIIFTDQNISFEVTQVCFCALYRKDKILKGVVTVNCDPIASQMASDLTAKQQHPFVGFPSYIKERFPNCTPIIEQIYIES